MERKVYLRKKGYLAKLGARLLFQTSRYHFFLHKLKESKCEKAQALELGLMQTEKKNNSGG